MVTDIPVIFPHQALLARGSLLAMRQAILQSAHESGRARTNRAEAPGRPLGNKKRGGGPKPAPSSESSLPLAAAS
jgi:hypothetical protein